MACKKIQMQCKVCLCNYMYLISVKNIEEETIPLHDYTMLHGS
jgi:hypothetical protein